MFKAWFLPIGGKSSEDVCSKEFKEVSNGGLFNGLWWCCCCCWRFGRLLVRMEFWGRGGIFGGRGGGRSFLLLGKTVSLRLNKSGRDGKLGKNFRHPGILSFCVRLLGSRLLLLFPFPPYTCGPPRGGGGLNFGLFGLLFS